MNHAIPVLGRTYYASNGESFFVKEVLTSGSMIGWLVLIVWKDGHISVRGSEDWPGGPL